MRTRRAAKAKRGNKDIRKIKELIDNKVNISVIQTRGAMLRRGRNVARYNNPVLMPIHGKVGLALVDDMSLDFEKLKKIHEEGSALESVVYAKLKTKRGRRGEDRDY